MFGKVVGGLDTLANLERVETDNKDVPIEDLILERAIVFVDPFTEADEQVWFFISSSRYSLTEVKEAVSVSQVASYEVFFFIVSVGQGEGGGGREEPSRGAEPRGEKEEGAREEGLHQGRRKVHQPQSQERGQVRSLY